MKFCIVSDSSCDLSEDWTKRAGVSVVPFYVSLNGKEYLQEGKQIAVTDFYREMEARPDCFPKTSMPSVQDYMDAFLPAVKEGLPVLCICLTRNFSGSMEAAANARTALTEDFPEAEIEVMDSRLATGLQGLFVEETVRLRDCGASLRTAVRVLERIRESGRIFFTTKDLKYLERGGRIGKAACVVGSVLEIKPLLQFYDGELGPTELCRGRKRSLQKVAERLLQYVEREKIDLKGYRFATGEGLPVPEYLAFREDLKRRLEEAGNLPGDWDEIQIGATIGVHTGPYPVGAGFLRKWTPEELREETEGADVAPGCMRIRREEAEDYEAVRQVVQAAFAGAERADGTEQDLVEELRKSEAFLPELSLVAEIDGRIAGHILFTKARAGDTPVLALAPLSVLPEYQGRGVGTALIREGHRIAGELGYRYSVVLGSENYYPRAGYRPAETFGIEPPPGFPRENFMAYKIGENAPEVSGTMRYAEEFGI